ncbi:MAG: TonB-dependent receptor [Acidobacteria bacterium]|nr:TonB-dependent receptor [Acidobacteriota bacterium]
MTLLLFTSPGLAQSFFNPSFVAVAQERSITVRGRVVDANSGEPMANVRVGAKLTDKSTITDANGAFTLELPPGPQELYISTVTYGLVKKTINVAAGMSGDIQIALNEDAAALTEQVTIASDPFESTRTTSTFEQTLNKRELQATSSILLSDPIRAAQTLPGVASNDDFRSEFSVRGAGFDRVGVWLDGVLTDNFVHTVAGGYPDTGSLSVINSDAVNSVSLLSGGSPASFGNRTAAVLDLDSRDGNRVKPSGRIAAALSGVSAMIDGPISGGKGSYLVAARKSYVGYLVRRINDENQFTNNPPILGFADVQGKLLYDFSPRNQVGVSAIFGSFDYDRNRDRELLFENAVFRGESRNLLLNAHWSFTPNPRVFWQTRFFALKTSFNNVNRDELILNDGDRSQLGVRSDVSFQLPHSNRLEAGLYVRSLHANSLSQRVAFGNVPFDFGSFDENGTEQAWYAQDTWRNERLRLQFTGGLRVEHSGITSQTLNSPRASLTWSINDRWRVHAMAGRYYQFPDFELVFGRLGSRSLRAQGATNVSGGIEALVGDRVRLSFEVFDREDANLFFTLSEPRLDGGQVSFAEFPFRNALDGHARGFELSLQRRSANKLAGWISYSYLRTKLTDSQTGLSFVGDTEQRHLLNTHASYRFTDTWNLSGVFRFGTGPPIPGFFRQVGDNLFLSDRRNEVRVPDYARLDVRVSKAFLFKRWKLTATAEVLNLLNRNNVRYAGFDGFDPSTGRVFGQLDRVLPLLPSAGVVIEF